MAVRSVNSRQLLEALTRQLAELGRADPAALRTVHAALVEAELIIGAAAERVGRLAEHSSAEPSAPPAGGVPMTVFRAPGRVGALGRHG